MLDPDSRYAGLPTTTWIAPDGRVVTYLTRRFLPRASASSTLVELSVGAGDRLDLVAARAFGDPGQWWRIADANEAMDPAELVSEPGTTLRIALLRP